MQSAQFAIERTKYSPRSHYNVTECECVYISAYIYLCVRCVLSIVRQKCVFSKSESEAEAEASTRTIETVYWLPLSFTIFFTFTVKA